MTVYVKKKKRERETKEENGVVSAKVFVEKFCILESKEKLFKNVAADLRQVDDLVKNDAITVASPIFSPLPCLFLSRLTLLSLFFLLVIKAVHSVEG